MKVVIATSEGGPEVLSIAECPSPTPGKGEVLIEVRASGLNGADLAQRKGLYPPPPGASEILGLEVSGVVTGLGEGASGFSVGDKVCALLTGGGYAQLCVVPASQVAPLPNGLSFAQGAGLMETLCTVWLNVVEIGQLKEGETFLVHGGASGIGTAAIQLASSLGAKVLATAGSDKKAQLCRELGASLAINYREKSFSEEIRSSRQGVDLILDMVGGSYFEQNMKCLNAGGRMIVIAFQGGRFGQIDLGRLLIRNIQIRGSTLRSRPVEEKAALVKAVRENVWPLIENGTYKVVIDSTFSPEEVGDAHRHMESSSHMGKIVLIWEAQ